MGRSESRVELPSAKFSHKNKNPVVTVTQNGTGISKVMNPIQPHTSTVDAILTYLCYLVILIVGYVNDFIRPETSREKHRAVRNNFFL